MVNEIKNFRLENTVPYTGISYKELMWALIVSVIVLGACMATGMTRFMVCILSIIVAGGLSSWALGKKQNITHAWVVWTRVFLTLMVLGVCLITALYVPVFVQVPAELRTDLSWWMSIIAPILYAVGVGVMDNKCPLRNRMVERRSS